MFKWVFNPILWILRGIFLIATVIAVIVGVATFFFHGWFVAAMSMIMYGEYVQFHNGCRAAFKYDPHQDPVEFALSYKAPPQKAYTTIYGRDLASAGMQDGHEHILVPYTPYTPRKATTQCPDCRVEYEAPFPAQCRHCGFSYSWGQKVV